MIAIYVHEIAATGVVRNALAIAGRLAREGHGVDLVTALPGGHEAVPPGVRHTVLLAPARRSRAAEQLLAVAALRRHLAGGEAAIIVSAGNHGHATVWAATRGLARPRRIYRISNDTVRAGTHAPGTPIGRSLRAAMAGLIARDAARLVLVSATLAARPCYARAIADGRGTIIANGVDVAGARIAAQAPPDHPWFDGEAPLIVAVGRLNRQKNFATLIAATALLQRQVPARLLILGGSRDGAREALAAQAARLGVGDRVALPGTVANVFAWMARADVFALPSWWEGSPNVLLEAIATGVPVVASRTAGNAAEILDHGRYGRLVDPADPQALADALALQLRPATAIRPGDRAAAFDLAANLDRWAALAGELLADAPPRRAGAIAALTPAG
ncbi:glycosyltransferase [Sphingomonas profundi]|uniref:glycosyltransferase n=1 Tax=Alterirhizorhabdus profundi TaxID=2681549 RepID=UPI0012E81CBA|nr:glycosyltransferase [Sphingomonas profundi]